MAHPHEVGDGDSYMMTIIGLHQYRSDYHIIVPEGFSSFVGITFFDGNDYGFELDQKILKPANIVKMDIHGNTYATFSHVVTDGAHRIRHMKSKKSPSSRSTLKVLAVFVHTVTDAFSGQRICTVLLARF
jgi:hypothetical protein